MEKSDGYQHIHELAAEHSSDQHTTPACRNGTPRRPMTLEEIAADLDLCERIGVTTSKHPDERIEELRKIWYDGLPFHLQVQVCGILGYPRPPLSQDEIKARKEIMDAIPIELSEEEFQELRKIWA